MSIYRNRGPRDMASRHVVSTVAIVVAFAWLVVPAAAQEKKQDPASAAKPATKPSAPAAGVAKQAPPTDATKSAAPAGKAATAPAATPAPPPAAEPAETKPAAPVSYKQDVSDEDLQTTDKKFKKEKTRSIVQKILRAQVFAAGEEAVFDSWYNEYALPRWTSPANYTSLPDYRRELRTDLLNSRSGPPYDRLLRLTLDYMTKAIGPEYHPVVRYNATVVLGDLNVQEFAPGSRGQIQPLPAALKILMDAVKNSDSDAVRVAALLGLRRHADQTPANSAGGITDPQVRDGQLIPMLVALITSPAPAGRSAEAHGWLRAMAIEVLASLRSVGPNGSVVTALVGVVSDKTAPMMTRCAAARALGSFDYKGFTALAPGQLAVPIGQFVAEASSAELRKARLSGLKAPAKGGPKGMGPGMGSMMPGSSMMPGMSSMPSMPGMPGMGSSGYGAAGATASEDEEAAARALRFRRSLKYYLNMARLGLNGPADNQIAGLRKFAKEAKNLPDDKDRLAADPDYRFIDGMLGCVQQQIRLLDKEEEDYKTLSQDLTAAKNKLQDLLKGGPSAPPPAPDKAAAKGAAKK